MLLRYLLLLFACVWITVFRPVSAAYYYKQISLEQGLSHSTVTSVLCDSKGEIWIGTVWGLNRLDRDQLRNYFCGQGKESSLPGDMIRFVAEDSLGNIWVATNNGLACYDARNDRFFPIILGNKVQVYSCCPVPGGMLFGGERQIFFYSYKDRSLAERIVDIEADSWYTEFNKLLPSGNNTFLIVSRERGLWIYDAGSGSIRRKHVPELMGEVITMASQDSRGNFYVSPFRKGLYCFDGAGKMIYHLDSRNSGLSNDIILDMAEKDGKIWLATDGGGINVMDLKTHSFQVLRHMSGDPTSLPVNSVTCLHLDSDRNLWAGSVRGGMFGIKEVFIQTYKDVARNNSYGLTNKAVIGLYEDHDGILWIGTDGEGLNRFDPGRGIFTHYPSTYGWKVVSVTGYSDRELLISCFCDGLYLFDKQSGRCRPFIVVDKETDRLECASGFTALAYRIPGDRICILARRIYIYDLKDGKFTEISTDEDQRLLSAQSFIDSDGQTVWLQKGNGIYGFDLDDMKIRLLKEIRGQGRMSAVCRDPDGGFWIGSDTGLSRYVPETGKTEHMQTSLFSSVSALAVDSRKRLWIGAHNMLFSYMPEENRFVVWSESDGFTPNELFHIPPGKFSGDYTYIGGGNGLVKIHGDINYREDSLVSLSLSRVMLNGAEAPVETGGGTGKISLPWNYSSLAVRVISGDKDVFRKILYRYRIEGDLKHEFVQYSNVVSLASLPPGNYTITCSCNLRSGEWTEPVKILEIEVNPPWYQNRFVIASGWLLLLGGIGSGIFLYLKKKDKAMKRKIEEHRRKNDEDKIRFLLHVNHELRTPLTLLSAPLKRLLDSDVRLDSQELKKRFQEMYRQTIYMKNTINTVLEVCKMSEGRYQLNRNTVIYHPWIIEIAEDFRNEFESKGVSIEYAWDDGVKQMDLDKEKCRIVLSNLLMNALKFSSSGSCVRISTQLSGMFVRTIVADQGIGFGGVDPENLFTHFYQGRHDRGGSGIGLSESRMLVEMHGGIIGASANEDGGATFYFDLPLEEKEIMTGNTDLPVDFGELVNEVLQEKSGNSKFDMSGCNLLIVEDKTELQQFLKTELSPCFRNVYVAADGVEALECVRDRIPDIVVSDVMMPRMNGYELCQKLKGNPMTSHIQVILLTAVTGQDYVTLGYELGADAYVSKPFEIDFLQTVLQKQLRSREVLKHHYRTMISSEFEKTPSVNNSDEKFLREMNKLVADNLGNPDLDVAFITEKMLISRASLYKKVKALTDMGVNDYINNFRIEQAARLLKTSDLNITEISEIVGFTYPRYFSAVFKQMKGILPSQYRQQEQKNDGMVDDED